MVVRAKNYDKIVKLFNTKLGPKPPSLVTVGDDETEIEFKDFVRADVITGIRILEKTHNEFNRVEVDNTIVPKKGNMQVDFWLPQDDIGESFVLVAHDNENGSRAAIGAIAVDNDEGCRMVLREGGQSVTVISEESGEVDSMFYFCPLEYGEKARKALDAAVNTALDEKGGNVAVVGKVAYQYRDAMEERLEEMNLLDINQSTVEDEDFDIDSVSLANGRKIFFPETVDEVKTVAQKCTVVVFYCTKKELRGRYSKLVDFLGKRGVFHKAFYIKELCI